METSCVVELLIREATYRDLPALVKMGLHFHEGSPYRQHIKENPAQMRRLATTLIAGNTLLVSEKDGQLTGMFGYVLYPHFISGEQIAGEVFWWVEPEHRGDGKALLLEAERRAKRAGAIKMQMIAPDPRVGKLYQRLGYGYVESTYQRIL